MSISHLVEILLLGYADDIVIIADSTVMMNKIFKYLHEYCIINELEFNLLKTKVVLFQKGGHGHKKSHSTLFFGSELVEYVREYTYLGVIFSQTALFASATSEMISRASTLSLCNSLSVNSWKV